jgi:anti-anti-sigma regulatory factor
VTIVDPTAATTTGDRADHRAQAPAASIDVHHVDAAGGVIITVVGAIGCHDAAVLSRHLHAELDADPTVVVVNLSRVSSCGQAGREVLAAARERARATGVGLHLVDLGRTVAREWLTDAGLGCGPTR